MAIESSSPTPVSPVSSNGTVHRHAMSPRHTGTPKRPDTFTQSEARRSAGRPPEGQGFFNTLFHPFAPERKRRHQAKSQSRALLRASINLIYEGKTQASHDSLRAFIRHCSGSLLNIDHELMRGAPSSLHPVEEILRAGDYDAILVLAPALKAGKYGAVFVNRSDSGFYIGEGIWEGTAPTRVFQARGHGILMCDGQRTEGEWRNNEPHGLVKHFPKDGPLRCYEGQVKSSRMHGKGRAEYTDGRVLRGSWFENVRDGQGEMTWPNGDILKAVWKDGLLERGAILDTADGRRFEGSFDEETCRPEGQCSITWQHGPQVGARYDGPVKDGVANGEGSYMFGSDERLFGFLYEGPFFQGTKHGVGKLVELSTESKQRCHFANDVLKTPMPQRTQTDSDYESDG